MKKHSPHPSRTDGEATNPGPWQLQRGPRSQEAEERRRSRNSTAALLAETRQLLWETGFYNNRPGTITSAQNVHQEEQEVFQSDQREKSFTETVDTRDNLALQLGGNSRNRTSHCTKVFPSTGRSLRTVVKVKKN